MAKYKEGNSGICVELWDLSRSKDRTPETCRGITIIINFEMEMRGYFHGLPRGKKRNDAIWMVVDRLTKSALFFDKSFSVLHGTKEWRLSHHHTTSVAKEVY